MVKSMIHFNVKTVRKDFPILSHTMNGKRLTYLDSAASAQKPQQVIDAMTTFQSTSYANIHRGLYDLSQKSTTAYEAARHKVATFLNAPNDTIIFTRNATEAINLVAQSWGRANLKAGDGILISELEHHANIVPWHMLRDVLGIELHIAKIEDNGDLTCKSVLSAIKPNTKLIAITHMSNALGTVPPLKKIIAAAHAKNIPVLVDGSQMVVHSTVDVQDLDADFYVFTGHKLYGPTGIGVLYAKAELLENMPPYQGGGDMINTVSFKKITYAKAPAKFEAGTPNIIGVIGLGAAIDYLNTLDSHAIQTHEHTLLQTTTQELSKINGINIIGTAPNKQSILSFTITGCHPHDAAMIFDKCGVAVRTGHHCCMPLMQRLGVNATIRASFALYNNEADIEQFLNAIHTIKKVFKL